MGEIRFETPRGLSIDATMDFSSRNIEVGFNCENFSLIPKKEEKEVALSTYVYLRFEDQSSKKQSEPTFKKKSSLYLYKLQNLSLKPWIGQIVKVKSDDLIYRDCRLRVEGILQAEEADMSFIFPKIEIKKVCLFPAETQPYTLLKTFKDNFTWTYSPDSLVVTYQLKGEPANQKSFNRLDDLNDYFSFSELVRSSAWANSNDENTILNGQTSSAVMIQNSNGLMTSKKAMSCIVPDTASNTYTDIAPLTSSKVLFTATVPDTEQNLIDKKEKKNMFKNFNFGEIKSKNIAASFNGLAFKNASDDFVVYNADGGATNVNDMVFDVPLWSVPTPLSQIKKDDVIYINSTDFGIVKEVKDKSLVVIKPYTQEITEIISAKSIFGFDYVSKIMNPLTGMPSTANEANPFGNMLPLMLMSKDNENDDSMKNFLMMSMFAGDNAFGNNPMLPFLLMSNKNKDNDMMMAMMMMGMNTKTKTEVEGN